MDQNFVGSVSPKLLFPLFESIRKSLSHYFASHSIIYPLADSKLSGRCGVFITYRDNLGNIRGSMGLLDTDKPLYQSAIDCAISAAKDDPRYEKIIINDVNTISIELTLIGNIDEITGRFEDTKKIYKSGKHGFYAESNITAGVLLPREIVNEKLNTLEQVISYLNSKCGITNTSKTRYYMFSTRIFLQTAPGSEVIEI